ncbi:hypothetical protein LTR95_007837 [Oleoguttula sp. CCFEE 5521]
MYRKSSGESPIASDEGPTHLIDCFAPQLPGMSDVMIMKGSSDVISEHQIESKERKHTCRLIDGRALPGPYATLSYRWGTNDPSSWITTEDNIAARKIMLSEAHLPKTLRDAIQVARGLHIRYLWIDAICIVQRSIEAWLAESAKMAAVFEQALVTICASSSSSSEEGIFNARSVNGIESAVSAGRDMITISSTLQCGEPSELHVEFVRGFQPPFLCSSLPPIIKKQTLLGVRPHQGIGGYTLGWRKILDGGFTLIALSGLARKASATFRCRYLAGIWADSLSGALTWRFLGDLCSVQTCNYAAPSWSWASQPRAVVFAHNWQPEVKPEYECRLVDANMQLAGLDEFGAVKSGTLKLLSKIWVARVVQLDVCMRDPDDPNDLHRVLLGDMLCEATFDDGLDSLQLSPLIAISTYFARDNAPLNDTCEFLLVQDADQFGLHRRVGTCSLPHDYRLDQPGLRRFVAGMPAATRHDWIKAMFIAEAESEISLI